MNTDKTADNASANDKDTPNIIKQIGQTTYDVFIHFSETSKETMTDKILRLIRNEKLK